MILKNFSTKNLMTTAIAASLWLPMECVKAQDHGKHMGESYSEEHAHDHGDNPLVAKAMFDQLEIRDSEGTNPSVIEAQAWIGKDLHKLWLKTDVETRDGEPKHAEIQALYSHAIAPYWDLQIGARQDIKPTPTRTWGVIGLQGLAPYFFEVDAALFIGGSGRTALRFSAEYEVLLTQRLILAPEVTMNIYGQTDTETSVGSGLSDINAGLRLRYEIRREFAPYIGINWSKKFGGSADIATENHESISETEALIGVRLWF